MKKPVKFEATIKRLETIVSELERTDLDLDRGLALYEEGIKLVRICSSRLEEVKQKVEILTETSGGLAPRPFKDTGDDDK